MKKNLKFSPDDWSKALFEAANTGAMHEVQSLGDFGEETAAEVMGSAQKWATQFTVVIGTTGTVKNSKQATDMTPGSGVVVQLHSNIYGVLTAGHVLRRGDNARNNAGVTVLAPSSHGKPGEDIMAIDLSPRPCTVTGFDNQIEDGPDIAIIPLTSGEMSILDKWGIIAYNLTKERWPDENRAKLERMNPWRISIINGVRCEASKIVYGNTDGTRGSLAIVATNTLVEVSKEKDGYDYLELPSETTEHSYPTHWKETLPGTAAEEIEYLHDKGVTSRAWGGISGAGVWNLAIGTTQSGLPNGRVFGELAGICFYANPDKGCIIAHGTKSITKIAENHIEKEALRYHNKA